ncbi:MAG: proteasome subunit alpha, partial [Actinomycetota bacterium]
AEGISKRLESTYRADLDLATAVKVAVAALSGPDRTVAAADLEIATLVRNGRRRSFTRITDDAVAAALR